MRELVATLHSVERRLMAKALPTEAWVLMADTLSICSPTGEAVALTATEMDLLKCLTAAAPEPVSRKALAAAMGHPEPDFDYRRLEVTFSRGYPHSAAVFKLCCGSSGALAAAGSHIVTVVPAPNLLSMFTSPPCNSTISRTMLMPRPVPGILPDMSAR